MENTENRTQAQILADNLGYRKTNFYEAADEAAIRAAYDYAPGYMKFLDEAKTEREASRVAIAMAEANGYVPYTFGMKTEVGGKYYYNNRGRNLYLFRIGTEPIENGVRIVAAHIDNPRVDVKQSPLYEDGGFAFFKTRYYGGIRKYQWVTIPLALHGVVIKKNGETVDVVIGEDESDPVIYINDLLPHLGQEQNQKPLGTAIPAENLNLLLGTRPFPGADKDAIKLNILSLLNEKYGITEDDFTSAELEAVPAVTACDIGLDRSMIGAYGHDDRVCGYAALRALLDLEETPARTAVCVLADKEEIGSDGVTGMQSAAFDTFMEDLCEAQGAALRSCYEGSFCLSADVTAAFDPNFAEVFEKRNAAYLNYGIGLCKYTGARGKSGASDADAETVAYVRGLFDRSGVIWQIAELGKVDAGGGGTVAMYMANRNITTLDAGVPVLSMHAPFEVVSKLDCYETYKGMAAVYRAER